MAGWLAGWLWGSGDDVDGDGAEKRFLLMNALATVVGGKKNSSSRSSTQGFVSFD